MGLQALAHGPEQPRGALDRDQPRERRRAHWLSGADEHADARRARQARRRERRDS